METDPLLKTSARQNLYQSLSILDSNNIRVLDLLPGSRIGRLRARLRIVPLSSKSEYVALSYTWGESTRGRKILLNDGLSVDITDNLYQALLRQRSVFTVRTLWIDALCINQADDAERSQQVPRMGSIYKNAACVNAWLGEPGFVFPISLTTLHFISWHIRTQSRSDWWRDCLYLMSRAFTIHPEAMEKAIRKSSPRWHERVWVAQEYILATKIHFCFGKRTIDEDLAGWTSDVARKNAVHFTHLMAFSNRRELWRRISWQKRFTEEEPEHLAANSFAEHGTSAVANCSSSDPRDRVYGMLGCIRSKEADLIPADYTLPCWQVFAKATAACMVLDQTHSILQLVNTSAQRKPELPTWTVDFETVGRMIPEQASALSSPLLRFSGVVQHTYLDYPGRSMNALHVWGLRCSTVVHVLSLEHEFCDGRRSKISLSSNMEGISAYENTSLNSQHCDSDTSPEVALPSNTIRTKKAASTDCESFLLAELSFAREDTNLQQVKSNLRSLQRTGMEPFLPTSLRSETCFLNQIQTIVRNWITCILNAANNLHVVGNAETSYFSGYKLGDLYEYVAYALAASQGCCLFWTTGDLVGLAPKSVEVGDKLVLTHGHKFPFLLLREVENYHLFQGLPFMHGLELNLFPHARVGEDLASAFGEFEELEMFEIR